MRKYLVTLLFLSIAFVLSSCSDNDLFDEQNQQQTINTNSKERIYEIDYSLPEMINQAFITSIIKIELENLEVSDDNVVIYFNQDNNLVFSRTEILNFSKEEVLNPSIKTDNKDAYYGWVEDRIEEGWIVTGYYDKDTGYYYGYTQKKTKP